MPLKRNFLLLAAFVCFGANTAPAARAADPWKEFTANIPGKEVQFLKADDDGSVWVGTLSGLARIKDGQAAVVLKHHAMWDLCRVSPTRCYIGTDSGVVRLDGAKEQNGLFGNTVSPIVPYDPQTVWAISKDRRTERNTLMACTDGTWTPVPEFAKQKVNDLKRMADGSLWVSLEGDGLMVVDPTQGPKHATRQLPGANVTALMEDAAHHVWAGLWGGGVRVWDGAAWTAHLKTEKSYVFSMRQDKAGQIWVATNQSGLYRYDGKQWINDLQDEGGINLLETTSDGKVWISTQTTGGLRYWDGQQWVVSLDNPLPVRCLLETPDHQLWAGGVLDGLRTKPLATP